MLAGNMKRNHFLLIVAAVATAGIAGLYFTCRGDGDSETASNRPAETTRARPATPAIPPDRPNLRPDTPEVVAPLPDPAKIPAEVSPNPTTPAPPPPVADGVREVDRELLKWQGKDLGDSKRKDVTKGRPYKINLYQDAGKTVVNRAKVDLDRDDKWDEKITFDGPNISRQVAPADDESYTEGYVWNGTAWVAE